MMDRDTLSLGAVSSMSWRSTGITGQNLVRVYHRYRPAIPEPAPFLSQRGAAIGGIWVFSCYQNNCDSWGAYVLRPEREDKHVWICRTARKDCGRILFVFVSMCLVGKNLNIPSWSSMAVDAITWGGIEVLGSLFYFCWVHTVIAQMVCSNICFYIRLINPIPLPMLN